jgi:TPP-dependent indolepyruvate ferredoxin oxidoreductase alpha subunit
LNGIGVKRGFVSDIANVFADFLDHSVPLIRGDLAFWHEGVLALRDAISASNDELEGLIY